jgi:hypothetical protein
MEINKKKSMRALKREEISFSQSAIDDLLVGKFDSTWGRPGQYVQIKSDLRKYYQDHGYSYDGEYHYFDRIPPENVHDDKKDWVVPYRYNEHFYRSDTFTNNHDGLHVVFGGCSNTEGVGSPIDRTWSHLLYEELSKKYKMSGYFNLGKGGYGWHKIISSFLEYERNFGTPDVFFVLHPNLLRDYYWDKERNGWIYAQQYPYCSEGTEQEIADSKNFPESHPYANIDINVFPTLEDYRHAFPVWINAWNLFLEYCKAKNIRVVWGLWDAGEASSFEDSGMFLDSYVRIPWVDESFISSIRKDGILEKDDVNARDGHPGFLSHMNWKTHFLNFINEGEDLSETYKKND